MHHLAAVVLRVASWLTLLAVMVLVALDIDGPSGRTADWLFGIPAGFRVVAWVLYAIRGTHLAWAGVLVDLAMASVAFDWLDWSGNDKGNLLLLSLFCTSAIPLWWLLSGKRWGAGFAAIGAVFSVVATIAVEVDSGNDLVIVVLILLAILGSWGADGAVLLWALQTWRDDNLDPDVLPETGSRHAPEQPADPD